MINQLDTLPDVQPVKWYRRVNAAWLMSIGDQGICSVGNFAAGVILGRGGKTEQFGLYLLAFSVLLISIDVLAAFLTTPFTVNAPLVSQEDRHMHTGTVLMQLLLVCTGFAATMAVGTILLKHADNQRHYDVIARLLLFVSAPILVREGLRRVSFALLDFRSALIMDAVAMALQVCSLLWLKIHGNLSAATALGSAAITSSLAAVVWLYIMLRHISFSTTHLRHHSMSSFKMGGWVFSSGLLWTLLTNTYVWILSAIAGYTQSARWGACLAITASCNPLFLGLQNYIGPRVAHACASQREKLTSVMNRQTLWFCLTLLPISLILMMSGGVIVKRVYGPSYAGCGLIMIFLAINMLASAAGFSPSRALFSLGRANFDFFVNAAALVFAFATSLVLIRAYGVVGAAVSLLMTNFLATISRQLIANKFSAHKIVVTSVGAAAVEV